MAQCVYGIACGVLALDLREAGTRRGIETEIRYLPGGLHADPSELKRRAQEAIDEGSALEHVERIVIAYGLCGMGTAGLHARNLPLVIPRVHDCIALLLGSDAAYQEQFARWPGTYYVAAGWVEEKAQPQTSGQEIIQCGPTSYRFEDLVACHGRENAEAIRSFLNSWRRNYQRAAYIETGVEGARRRYAELAQAMAREFGWRYEELRGSHALLEKLLAARHSTDEVLVVPPHHVTVYDAAARRLEAVPVWEAADGAQSRDFRIIVDDDTPAVGQNHRARLGLGIDAGGTYTDVVLFDFRGGEVVAKAKALTTRWDFTVGIDNALEKLDRARLAEVDLVAVSTTLATNAIVEGRGQKVGLLVMPPYGLFESSDITYRPIAVIDGRMEIDGRILAPVDPEQIRGVVQEMIEKHEVGALAIAGYASHANPAHELEVRSIIAKLTSLRVTCAHEVSEQLNYRVRAVTAALNASIIPCLEALLRDAEGALARRGIHAPKMVVRSDGSLMSLAVARQRPIETILSGPAASAAGATFLAHATDATVVDMGGTTTDTARIRGGSVQMCARGASVGAWRTHVEALELRTLGLGGDSLLALERGRLAIGPLRVAPVSWHFDSRDPTAPLDWLRRHLDRFRDSTRGMDLVALNGTSAHGELSEAEQRLVDALGDGPLSLHELADRVKATHWRFLPLDRLERRHALQRSALTPTDVLHATGQLALWNQPAARRMCELYSRLLGVSLDQFTRDVLRRIVEQLATEVLRGQWDGAADAHRGDEPGEANSLVRNWLDGGRDGYRVRVALTHPIIGIGAPAHLFVPEAARLLETEAILPPHGDVANAIGAITSSVVVHRRVEISPGESGRYYLSGLPDAPSFTDFQQAYAFAVEALKQAVRQAALAAGTSQARLELAIRDRVAPTGFGGIVFIGRSVTARLSDPPDLTRLAAV